MFLSMNVCVWGGAVIVIGEEIGNGRLSRVQIPPKTVAFNSH